MFLQRPEDGRLQKQAAEIFGRIMSEGEQYPEIGEALFDVFNLNRSPESLMTDPNSARVSTSTVAAVKGVVNAGSFAPHRTCLRNATD